MTDDKRKLSTRGLAILWILVATLVMFVLSGVSVVLMHVLSPGALWQLGIAALVGFGVGGVAIGWMSSGRPTLEAGLGAAIVIALGLGVGRMKVALEIHDAGDATMYLGVIGALIASFGVAAGGAMFGRAMRVEQAKTKKDGPDAFDNVGIWLANHGALPALGAVTIAVFCFHQHVFRGEPVGDDLTFHFAESARLADCIRHGDFDFWNPSANGGYASAYYYQVLPQLASALPAALFGHHLFFFELSVALPLVLAPAAAYRGMRLMGATPWQSAVGAFAVAFMNGESRWGSGNAGTFQVGLYTQTWALCVFPLALGHGARWISQKKSLAPAIAWGGFAFLCHPFAGVSLGLALVIAFLCKFAVTWRLWLSPTMDGLIAIYLGGVQVVAVVVTSVIPNVPPLPICAEIIAAFGAVMVAAVARSRCGNSTRPTRCGGTSPCRRSPASSIDSRSSASRS